MIFLKQTKKNTHPADDISVEKRREALVMQKKYVAETNYTSRGIRCRLQFWSKSYYKAFIY